jgi:dinuclear metal center YbgI/SA1388 family protein
MNVADVISYLEQLAPPSLAKSGDPIGLHVGDASAAVTKIATAVDCTKSALDRAAASGAEMLVCHHPLIYRPIGNVTASNEKGDLVMRAVRAGIAVYVMHTNLDSAPGGVNDVLAEKLGVMDTELLSVTSTEPYVKVVVFVPDDALENVRAAMCGAGGFIGNYSDCSFRAHGVGTFKPLEGAQPYIGEAGKLEQADEWRLETLAPESKLSEVVAAMLQAHPYEEVAYDIYPLRNDPRKSGLGLIGRLEKTERLADFRARIESALGCPGFTRLYGDPDRMVETVALCGGNGSSLMEDAASQRADVYVTGDVTYHPALTSLWQGMAIIDAGHFETEKPGVVRFTETLARYYSELGIAVEYVDR